MTKKDLKIVFFGTPEFAVASLAALVDGGYNVAAVVTMPDKASGRGMHMTMSAVKKYAVGHGLQVLQPEKLKAPEFIDALRAIDAQLFIVIAFRMLPEVVWAMPELGTFNLHGSLLPKYRGAAPINRAIMNGETKIGVTTFLLKHEIDTGDVLAQECIEIGPDENVGSVYDRLMTVGARLTTETVDSMIAGTLRPVPQSELADGEPCPAPKIFKEDCRINWSDDAQAVHNHVRGLSPYPAAWTTITLGDNAPQTMNVKVLATRLAPEAGIQLLPGELTIAGKKAYAGCGDCAIELIEVQPAGKRAMAAVDYLRGVRPDGSGSRPHFV